MCTPQMEGKVGLFVSIENESFGWHPASQCFPPPPSFYVSFFDFYFLKLFFFVGRGGAVGGLMRCLCVTVWIRCAVAVPLHHHHEVVYYALLW